MKSLFDQLSDFDRDHASALIGCIDNASFRLTLRECAPLHDGFTMGDVAEAWLKKRLSEIQAIRARRVQVA
jgi:hypothetical protein